VAASPFLCPLWRLECVCHAGHASALHPQRVSEKKPGASKRRVCWYTAKELITLNMHRQSFILSFNALRHASYSASSSAISLR